MNGLTKASLIAVFLSVGAAWTLDTVHERRPHEDSVTEAEFARILGILDKRLERIERALDTKWYGPPLKPNESAQSGSNSM